MKKELYILNSNFQTFKISCDIADTYTKQVLGLQSYKTLPINNGLFFTYKKASQLSFWMGTVSFPIDILFIKNNQIIKICSNCKPGSQDIYRCDSADSVLELPGNYCISNNIKASDFIY